MDAQSPGETRAPAPDLSTLGFASPIGRLVVKVAGGHILRLTTCPDAPLTAEGPEAGRGLCREARQQVSAYLQGRLREFELPLLPQGTSFQEQVWAAMVEIPYAQTRSYGEIAQAIDNPGATRAVGSACGANPIPLILPCHRILAAAGRIGGFGLGLDAKRWLLSLEIYGRPPL